MLPERNRLKRKKDFENVKKNGILIPGRSIGVIFLDRKDDFPTRFGLIISTRVSKRAVIRNKVKRAIKKEILSLLPRLRNGFDVLFLVKKAFLLNNCDKRQEIYSFFKKIGLLKDE